MAIDCGMGEDVDVDVVESQAATHRNETRREVESKMDVGMYVLATFFFEISPGAPPKNQTPLFKPPPSLLGPGH